MREGSCHERNIRSDGGNVLRRLVVAGLLPQALGKRTWRMAVDDADGAGRPPRLVRLRSSVHRSSFLWRGLRRVQVLHRRPGWPRAEGIPHRNDAAAARVEALADSRGADSREGQDRQYRASPFLHHASARLQGLHRQSPARASNRGAGAARYRVLEGADGRMRGAAAGRRRRDGSPACRPQRPLTRRCCGGEPLRRCVSAGIGHGHGEGPPAGRRALPFRRPSRGAPGAQRIRGGAAARDAGGGRIEERARGNWSPDAGGRPLRRVSGGECDGQSRRLREDAVRTALSRLSGSASGGGRLVAGSHPVVPECGGCRGRR